jgi:hypothetical protein
MRVSTVLEIIGHLLLKGDVRGTTLYGHDCISLTQGTRIYMVDGRGSQRFSRYWSTSGLKGMGQFFMVMISIPLNVL